jgi:hypothetical protein
MGRELDLAIGGGQVRMGRKRRSKEIHEIAWNRRFTQKGETKNHCQKRQTLAKCKNVRDKTKRIAEIENQPTIRRLIGERSQKVHCPQKY